MAAFLLVTALFAGVVLAQSAARRRPADRDGARRARLITRIESLLPQTQCRQCGYAGCRPYAAAIADGSADVHRCPPGGAATVLSLERLLGHPDPVADRPLDDAPAATIAHIDEAECIGCVKCVRACPVDAIVGAAGQMHTVLADDCTGCALCIAPCPVDCITLVPAAGPAPWRWPRPLPSAATAG